MTGVGARRNLFPSTAIARAGSGLHQGEAMTRDEVSALSARLRRLLRRRGASRQDAEDAIQEAFERMYRYQMTRSVESPEAFLVRTVLNINVDRHRRSRSDRFVPDELPELCDSGPTAEEMAEEAQALKRIIASLDELNPVTRRIYLLHRIHGFSYTEVGELITMPVRTVEKHLMRARLWLEAHRGALS